MTSLRLLDLPALPGQHPLLSCISVRLPAIHKEAFVDAAYQQTTNNKKG